MTLYYGCGAEGETKPLLEEDPEEDSRGSMSQPTVEVYWNMRLLCKQGRYMLYVCVCVCVCVCVWLTLPPGPSTCV